MFTRHAKKRMKQRGISADISEYIMRYGAEHFGWGVTMYLVTKKIASRMLNQGISKSITNQCKGKYVIVKDGKVLTVAHITKRFHYSH